MDRLGQRRLLRLMADHGIGEFVHADSNMAVSLSLEAFTPLHPEIRASQAGRFLSRHPLSADGPDFPRRVHEGEIVAYLGIGMLLLPVTAAKDAILPQPLIPDDTIVGYGDVLF